jgi:hypothetical protein
VVKVISLLQYNQSRQHISGMIRFAVKIHDTRRRLLEESEDDNGLVWARTSRHIVPHHRPGTNQASSETSAN